MLRFSDVRFCQSAINQHLFIRNMLKIRAPVILNIVFHANLRIIHSLNVLIESQPSTDRNFSCIAPASILWTFFLVNLSSPLINSSAKQHCVEPTVPTRFLKLHLAKHRGEDRGFLTNHFFRSTSSCFQKKEWRLKEYTIHYGWNYAISMFGNQERLYIGLLSRGALPHRNWSGTLV